MSTILFVTWDGGGNVPPAIAIASELRERGHDVRFVGHPVQAERFAAAGLPFRSFPNARPFTSANPGGPLGILGMIGDRAMGRDVVADLQLQPADLVVVDCLLCGVMQALRQAGYPYVVLEHTFDGWLRRAARGPMGIALRLRGFRIADLIDAGTARMATTIEALDEGHGDVRHIGPVTSGTPARPAQPTVLLSLSTYAFPDLEKTWQRVLDATDGLGARVVATTGPLVDPATLRVPANVEIHRWLDHREIMPTVSMVVGHGGHGTTIAALAHDLPVLILPLDPASDQPFVGRVVEAAGAGRSISRKSKPGQIRLAVEEMLGERHYREAAARPGALIRAGDGRAAGADLLEDLLTGSPSQPDLVASV